MASLSPSTQYRSVILQVWETFRTKDTEKLQKSLDMPEPFREAEELRDICDKTGLLAMDNINNFIEIIDGLHLRKASWILRNFKRKYITQTSLLVEQCSVHGSKKLIFICLSCQERLCQDCKVFQHARSCEDILTQEEYFAKINKTYDQISKKVSSSEQVIASLRSKQMNYQQELHNNRTSVSQSLKRDYDDMMKATEEVKSNFLEDISRQELSKTKRLLEIQLQLEDVNRIVSTTKDSPLILSDLRKRIKKAAEKLKILDHADKALTGNIELLRKGVTDITYSCTNKDGVFGEIVLLKPYKVPMTEEKNKSTTTETSEGFTKQLPSPSILPSDENEKDKTVKRFKNPAPTRDTCNEKIQPPQPLRRSHNPIETPDLPYQEEMDLDDVIPTISVRSSQINQLQIFTRGSYFSKSTSDISKEPDKSSLGMRYNPHESHMDLSKQKRYILKNRGRYVVRTFLPKK